MSWSAPAGVLNGWDDRTQLVLAVGEGAVGSIPGFFGDANLTVAQLL